MKEESDQKEVFFIHRAANLLKTYSYDEEKAWEKVRLQSIGRRKSRNMNWLKYAAVFIAGVGMAWWGYHSREEMRLAETKQMIGIPLAHRQVELILATGERVVLNDEAKGREILREGMNVCVDSTNRSLRYGNVDSSKTMAISGYNTLRVPKGGEYNLVLADGSEVRLNAESSLRFPVTFEKGIREVYLEGEAFFQVAPDANAPFHVYACGQDVCVLGTSFNISAYKDDPYFYSTLVTGKVKITDGNREVFLKPSEQYFENRKTGESVVRQVDSQLYTSWLEGKILFKGERLEDIVKKLQRWFDFEIFYADEEIKDMKFRGVIHKYDSFETVLKNLELTTDIQFNIQNKTVIVRKIYNN